MSTRLATCTLAVAGQRVADTSAAVGTAPAALAGLRVTWGRSDALSQPQAATCTARLLLPRAPGPLLDMLTIGRPLRVSASVTVWGSAAPTSLDLTHTTTHAARATRTAGAVTITPTSPAAAIALLPPAEPTSAVGAWDTLPTIAPAQTWVLTAQITTPVAPVTVTLHPAIWRTPTAAPVLGPALATTTAGQSTTTLTGSWHTSTAHAGCWVGLALRVWPAGPTWAQTTDPWTARTHTWADAGDLSIRSATITPPAALPPLTATVFDGQITDTSLQWDQNLTAPVLTLTATDLLARLAHVRVGADPWPEHTVTQRVAAILDAAGQDTPVIIDPAPGARHLAPIDIDAQTVTELLTAAATSAGAVLWATTHATTGPYLRLEDTARRHALSRLSLPATGPATVAPTTSDGYRLSAHHLTRSVSVTRNVAQAITSTRLTWTEPGVSEDGKQPTLTNRTITVADPDAQKTAGLREVSVSTNLSRAIDAYAVASRTARLTAAGGWALDSLTWDTHVNPDRCDPHTLAAVLDATRRMGAPIRLTDLPPWIPGAPTRTAYLDGGSLELTATKPRWVISMNLTTATTEGAGLTWAETPTALTWQRTGAITWAHTASIAP
jgi:hypothetical protein